MEKTLQIVTIYEESAANYLDGQILLDEDADLFFADRQVLLLYVVDGQVFAF